MNINSFFPFHLGSGNRGCEGIIRGIVNILQLPIERTYAMNESTEEKSLDIELGLGNLVSLITPEPTTFIKKILFLFPRVLRRLGICSNEDIEGVRNRLTWPKLTPNTIVFITGGDLYTYDGMIPKLLHVSETANKCGAKVVLFGCSMSERLLTDTVVDSLNKFAVICARESISYEMLKNAGIRVPLLLHPDPAFVLEPLKCALPEGFKHTPVVGLNISNFTNGGFESSTLFMKNIEKLLDYILGNTSLSVCLIPHVFWRDQDDRILIDHLMSLYKGSDRVIYLNAEHLSYQEIRYVISNCRFFIGARTHAVISAYSTRIPTIALGYSTKSIGIARDLGIASQYVVDCNNLTNEEDILGVFLSLIRDEEDIKLLYDENLKDYVSSAWQSRRVLDIVNE